jgi:hypothetical protein
VTSAACANWDGRIERKMSDMKVYLLLLGDGDYEAVWVESVWSTHNKAEEAMFAYLNGRTPLDTPDAAIEEWDVQ